ncbi:MAG: hypothetical protein F6J93_22765 [Oscillatoria sp. SIO1A7]|nr:hypothetical protein [Oscillatoria sp. SIO1A7]
MRNSHKILVCCDTLPTPPTARRRPPKPRRRPPTLRRRSRPFGAWRPPTLPTLPRPLLPMRTCPMRTCPMPKKALLLCCSAALCLRADC